MPDHTPLRAADVLARRLAEAGVRRAWGMPGGEVLTLVDALERAGIECVLCRHETAAGFMAEADWHATGAPGVMLATLGPGAMNGVNAVANAHQDRVPLIVLTGCVDEDEAATYTHQVLDHRAVLAPITKATMRLSAGTAGVIADRAVAIATSGRRGPVHVDVPIGAAAAAASGPDPRRAAPLPAVPDPASIARMRSALEGAERPLVLAGLDAMDGPAPGAVRALAEAIGAPVITTYKAKGVIDEGHPLALGGAGLSPLADGILLPLVRRADAILLAGYDPIEMRPGWRDAWDPYAQAVIDLSAAPNDHDMHHATISAVGDVAAALALLADDIADGPPRGWSREVAAAREALAAAFPADEDWGPAAIVDEARRALPDGTRATADSGAHRILLSQMWRCEAPRGLIQSSGLCTMGCGVPLAIGAAIAEPDRPVVAFTGDAGFLMAPGDLATAAERGARPIVIVFVDASLSLIEAKQRARQLPNRMVDFPAPDVAAMGRALGGAGRDVRSREELRAALAEAREAPTFTVIAAHIDRGAYDGRI